MCVCERVGKVTLFVYGKERGVIRRHDGSHHLMGKWRKRRRERRREDEGDRERKLM